MRFLRYKTLKSVMGSGRVGSGREYSDFSLKYERTRSARCARSLVTILLETTANRGLREFAVVVRFGRVRWHRHGSSLYPAWFDGTDVERETIFGGPLRGHLCRVICRDQTTTRSNHARQRHGQTTLTVGGKNDKSRRSIIGPIKPS